MRQLTYAQAINEALDQSLARDPRVILIGEGVPDPKGLFGTTLGLQKKHGKDRVFDMPVSENGVTGICVGAAISGLRPVMTHQRIDFALLSFDQIVNNAAKWYYMFGRKKSVPLVIRVIIGRGWGQGSQHSQSLQAIFAHIPGLKVVMPFTAYDAKGMLIAAIKENNPVIFIEHRWLHNTIGEVPVSYYSENLSSAKKIQAGDDVTIVATSYMTLEADRAALLLKKERVTVDLIDARSIKPLDVDPIIKSVSKTGRLLVCDTGYGTFGFSSEVIAKVSSAAYKYFKSSPVQITLPDTPTPTSWKLAERYYPTYLDIVRNALLMMEFPERKIKAILENNKPDGKIRSDVPDATFKGPF